MSDKIEVTRERAAKDLALLIETASFTKDKNGKTWSQKSFIGSVELELAPYVIVLQNYFNTHEIK